MKPKFYLTTPIYYPNARPTVGSAYTTVACDVIARYKRLSGYDVAFLTGTDEHGEKLERAAAEAGVPPPVFVAGKRELFRELWKLLNIQHTHFIYTDQPNHVISVQRLLRRAQDAGCVYKAHYQGRYCVHCELYVSDNTDPVDCPTCGRPAELVSEENHFFKLSAFQNRLLDHYEKHPEFVQPDFRRNEVISFVKSGLRDISISRKRIKWGIPWPDDPEQVFYVWYDALTSYLTGIGYSEGDNGNAEFQKYWPADLHMIGKDILRFHAVYWPAFLMAANLPLPETIFAHGWLLFEQEKMSKSKGNVVYCEPIVEALGSDALRYYLLRDVPFGQDSRFSYEGLIQRFNSDLANDLGNLASRTIAMINRYFHGTLPFVERSSLPDPPGGRLDLIGSRAWDTKNAFRDSFENYEFSRALEAVWKFVGSINSFLVQMSPWALAQKDFDVNKPWLAATLYTAAEAVRFCTVLLYPVLPHSAERMWKQLGEEGNLEDQRLDDLKWGQLKAGTKVGQPKPIFPRLDVNAAIGKLIELGASEQEIEKSAKKGTTVEPQAERKSRQPTDQKISIDDFAKIDMRVGEVLSAEAVPGAQKLLKLMVDIGAEVRQVVAGIAGYYQPERLVGMKVVLVTNLEPRKLRGVESNGMVVAATVGDEGRPVLVTFKEEVPNGAPLK